MDCCLDRHQDADQDQGRQVQRIRGSIMRSRPATKIPPRTHTRSDSANNRSIRSRMCRHPRRANLPGAMVAHDHDDGQVQ